MMIRRTCIAFALVAAVLLAGCSSSATSTPPAKVQQLYVADTSENVIFTFPLNASGAATPTTSIQGVATTLKGHLGSAVDHSGNV